MISSDLLRYKIDYTNNKIHPILCPIDNNSLEYQLAKKIIEIFDDCYINKNNKNKLNYMIKVLEYSQKDYKLVRGLYSIIEKKCIFKPLCGNENDTESENPNPLNKIVTKLTPIEIRRIIFQESALNNIAVTEDKRSKILDKISNKLNTDIKTIIKLMWADLEENTIIYKYSSPDPQLLLLYYNISLIQTLLFNCLKIEIKIRSMKSIGLLWKKILREIKRLGLMYWLEIDSSNTINNDKNDIICIVEGTSNIIKLTEKYGNSIAKLVPLIFKATNWKIKADILRTSSNGNKTIYSFEISEQSHSDKISTKIIEKIQESKYQNYGEQEEDYEKIVKENTKKIEDKLISKDEIFLNNKSHNDNNNTISYDSNIEKIFANKFELFDTGWTIEREPEPLITKLRTAFISDFILFKHQNKVLVEIIGFWTREYLERKIQKIIEIIENYNNNFYMILIINFENLVMYETNHNYTFSNIKNKNNVLIISYKNENISFKEIIPFLKKIERKYMDQNFENKIDKVKVIQEINEFLKGFKNSYDIKTTLEDLNKVIIENQNNLDPSFNLKVALENNHEFKIMVGKKIIENKLIMIKDFIFKDSLIKEIYNGLKDKETNNLKVACDFMISKNIPERIHIDLLTFLGFKIYWNGLDYAESKINFNRPE